MCTVRSPHIQIEYVIFVLNIILHHSPLFTECSVWVRTKRELTLTELASRIDALGTVGESPWPWQDRQEYIILKPGWQRRSLTGGQCSIQSMWASHKRAPGWRECLADDSLGLTLRWMPRQEAIWVAETAHETHKCIFTLKIRLNMKRQRLWIYNFVPFRMYVLCCRWEPTTS